MQYFVHFSSHSAKGKEKLSMSTKNGQKCQERWCKTTITHPSMAKMKVKGNMTAVYKSYGVSSEMSGQQV